MNNNTTVSVILDGRSPHVQHNRSAQDVLDHYITPVVCTFGFLGNIVNLVVLTRRRFRRSESGKETTAHLGLILLAVSDMLFCIVLFPRAFVSTTRGRFDTRSFALYYQAYSQGLVNTFIFTSTWITVALATLRYIAICHPFKARLIQDVVFTRAVYFVIFVSCVGINLPLYWNYQIRAMRSSFSNGTTYIVVFGELREHSQRGRVFKWFKAVLGIFLPAVVLLFCNCSLIGALRKSFRLRQQCHVNDSAARTKNKITLLLIAIAILFVVLVLPSEFLDFFLDLAASTESFLLARAVTNFLQVVNFAFNFVLYCAINTHFRAVFSDLFMCDGHCKNGIRSREGGGGGGGRGGGCVGGQSSSGGHPRYSTRHFPLRPLSFRTRFSVVTL